MLLRTLPCVLALWLAVTVQVQSDKVNYAGYELLRVAPKTSSDVQYLREMDVHDSEVDFWLPVTSDHPGTVLVKPQRLGSFKESLTQRGITFSVLNDDVQGLVDAGSARNPPSRSVAGYVDHSNYHNFDEIVRYVHILEDKFPGLVFVRNLDYLTRQGRPVPVVTISAGNPNTIIMEAGIHAREWISPASALYFMEKLLVGYQNGEYPARKMLETYTWKIIPVTNPDGYEYSINSDRMWRKNMHTWTDFIFSCKGVDLNRNFDARFGTDGVSSWCSSDIYPGEHSFSEPETQNVRNLVQRVNGSLKAYISVHSFSQLLLVPWSFNSNTAPPNGKELDRVGRLMTAQLESVHGKVYRYGTAPEVLDYAASGGSKDWVLKTHPGIYTYTYELRPAAGDPRGFILGAEEIIPQGEEFFASLGTLVREMYNH